MRYTFSLNFSLTAPCSQGISHIHQLSGASKKNKLHNAKLRKSGKNNRDLITDTRSYLRPKCRRNCRTENRIYFFFCFCTTIPSPFFSQFGYSICLLFLHFHVFFSQFPCHTSFTFSDSMEVNFAKQAFSAYCIL